MHLALVSERIANLCQQGETDNKSTSRRNIFMKAKFLNFSLLYILLLILVVSCSKNDAINNLNTTCSTSTFEISLEKDLGVIDLCEDNLGNVIILGIKEGQNKLLKLNEKGELLWSNAIDNSMTPREIIALSDNSVIILLKGESVKTYCDVLFEGQLLYAQSGIYGINCIPAYELGTSQCYSYNSEVLLLKIDTDGSLLWSKTIPDHYLKGNSLAANNDSDFYLLTGHFYGKQPEYVYNNQGEFADTINYPLDRNHLTLYNISFEGDINWESQIDNIYIPSYTDKFYPYISIAKVEESILIKGINEIIKVNNQGEEISRLDVLPDICHDMVYYLASFEEAYYLLSGSYSVYDETQHSISYTELRNLNHEIIWRKEQLSYLEDARGDNFVTIDAFSIDYFNRKGELLWTIKESVLGGIKINCNNGVIFSSFKNGQTYITKTDENGNYK